MRPACHPLSVFLRFFFLPFFLAQRRAAASPLSFFLCNYGVNFTTNLRPHQFQSFPLFSTHPPPAVSNRTGPEPFTHGSKARYIESEGERTPISSLDWYLDGPCYVSIPSLLFRMDSSNGHYVNSLFFHGAARNTAMHPR